MEAAFGQVFPPAHVPVKPSPGHVKLKGKIGIKKFSKKRKKKSKNKNAGCRMQQKTEGSVLMD